MAFADPIQLRLSVEKRGQYEDEAAARGMPLATYLRQRLEHGDQVAEQLAELRRIIGEGFGELRGRDDSAGSSTDAPADAGLRPAEAGMMTEMLLLLRSVVGGDKLQVAHGELRRQGLPVWTGQDRTTVARK